MIARLVPWLIVAAVVVVFAQVATHQLLLWDDNINITRNPHLNPQVTAAGVAAVWREPYAGLYIPATYTLLAGEKWLAERLSPDGPHHPARWVFHVGNLLLHAGCALLVYSLIKRVLLALDAEAAHRRGIVVAALAGALLFAVHPLQVEAVAWATEAKTLLATLLALASIRLYLATCAGATARSAWRLVLIYLLALACFTLALLAKPTVVIVPIVALVLAWVVERGFRLSHVARLAPWGALAFMLAWQNKSLQPDDVLVYVPSWIERPWIALDAVGFYAGKLVAPVALTIDYGHSPRTVLAGPWWPAALVAAVVLVLAIVFRRRPVALAALAIALVALLPVMGWVPFEFQNISTVADRYAYLAMLGPALGFAALLASARRGRGAIIAVAFTLLLLLAAMSMVQTAHWENDEALYLRTLAHNADSHVAHGNLAGVYMARGDAASAEPHFRHAVRTAFNDGTRTGDLTNLATALLNQRKFDESEQALRQALEIRPNRAQTLSTLANLHLARGELDEARAVCHQVLERRPDRAVFWLQLGSIEMRRDQLDAAQTAFAEAVELEPRSADALRGLAQIAGRKKLYQQALDLYDRAITAAPEDWQPHYDVGRLLYSLQQFDKAAHCFSEAAARNPASAMVHNNLGSTLVKMRRLSDAALHYRRALELDPQLTDARENLRKVEARLRQ